MSPQSSDRDNPDDDLQSNKPARPGPDVTDRIFEEICLEEINLDQDRKSPRETPADPCPAEIKPARPARVEMPAQEEICLETSEAERDHGGDPGLEDAGGRREICVGELAPGGETSSHLAAKPILDHGVDREPEPAAEEIRIEGLTADEAPDQESRVESASAEILTSAAPDARGTIAPDNNALAPAAEVIRIEGLTADAAPDQEAVRVEASARPATEPILDHEADREPEPPTEVIRIEGLTADAAPDRQAVRVKNANAEIPSIAARYAHGTIVPGEDKSAVAPAADVIRIEGLDPENEPIHHDAIRIEGIEPAIRQDANREKGEKIPAEEARKAVAPEAESVIRIEGLDSETGFDSEHEAPKAAIDDAAEPHVTIDWCADQAASPKLSGADPGRARVLAAAPEIPPSPPSQVTKPTSEPARAPVSEERVAAATAAPEQAVPAVPTSPTIALALSPGPAPVPTPGPASAQSANQWPVRKPDIQPQLEAGFPVSVKEVAAWVAHMTRHPFTSLRGLKEIDPAFDRETLDKEFELMYEVGGEWDPRAFFARYLRRPDAEVGTAWSASLRVEISYALFLLGLFIGIYIMTEMLR